MKSKQQTPLGYLMGLLDISLQDLGDYLYVSQTTISKWKTGARPLGQNSQHFAGIVEYFTMLSRDESRWERMAQLFEKLYPGQDVEEPDELASCVRAFLGGKTMPPSRVQQAISEEGRLYTAQVGVYGGEAGCQAALGQLAAYLDTQRGLGLAVMCRQDLAILPRFLPLIAQGMPVRLLVEGFVPSLMLTELAALWAHPSVEVRVLGGDAALPRRAAWYLAANGQLMLVTHAPQGSAQYAAMYTDAATLALYTASFEQAWQGAARLFLRLPGMQLGLERYQRANDETVDEWTSWLSPSLPYVTMSRELLMEVLRANDVSGRVWTHVLAGCDAVSRMRLRLYVPARALQGDSTVCDTLSVLCGKEIRLTQAERKRHLLDTAAMLRADADVRVCPVQGSVPEVWQGHMAYVKRNAFAGYIRLATGEVSHGQEAGFVTAMMRAMEALVAGAPNELDEPSYVAGVLERAALG